MAITRAVPCTFLSAIFSYALGTGVFRSQTELVLYPLQTCLAIIALIKRPRSYKPQNSIPKAFYQIGCLLSCIYYPASCMRPEGPWQRWWAFYITIFPWPRPTEPVTVGPQTPYKERQRKNKRKRTRENTHQTKERRRKKNTFYGRPGPPSSPSLSVPASSAPSSPCGAKEITLPPCVSRKKVKTAGAARTSSKINRTDGTLLPTRSLYKKVLASYVPREMKSS